MQRIILKILFIFYSFFFLSECMAANIYKYVDSEGAYHFSDIRLHAGYKILKGGRIYETAVEQFWLGSRKKQRTFEGMISRVALQYQLPADLIHAVIEVESNYNPNAISPAGAVGLMQLMPATSARFGVLDARNPIANVIGGAKYLRYLIDLFEEDLILVLAAYNAGENAVIKQGFKVPPFKETQDYVVKVLRIYNQ